MFVLDIVSYKLNYVEEKPSAQRNRWAFRHLGVYHHHRHDSDLFILLHCSEETALISTLKRLFAQPGDAPVLEILRRQPARLHEVLLSCHIENWRPYLREQGFEFSRIVSHFPLFWSTSSTSGKR